MKKHLVFLYVIGCLSITGLQAQFHLGADVGYGYRLGTVETDDIYLKDFIKGLRSGLSIGTDASFYLRPTFGFGMKYSFFYASNSWGDVWEKTYTNFVGPVFCGRSKPLGAQKSILLAYSAGIGYLHFRDKWSVDKQKGEFTAETYGIYTDFGLEIRLAPKLYLTGKVYLLGSNYNSYKQNSEKIKLDKPANVTRAGITAGLKFKL